MNPSMRALVFTAPGEVQLLDVPRPVASPGTVVLDVRASGICGSELHGFRHAGFRTPPLIMGHEFAGTTPDGRRVVAYPLVSCGACDLCRAGRTQICRTRRLLGAQLPGGFAEQVAVAESALHELPPGMSWQTAAMVEPVANAVHAWRHATLPDIPLHIDARAGGSQTGAGEGGSRAGAREVASQVGVGTGASQTKAGEGGSQARAGEGGSQARAGEGGSQARAGESASQARAAENASQPRAGENASQTRAAESASQTRAAEGGSQAGAGAVGSQVGVGRVAIVGAGTIGLVSLLVARHHGLEGITVVDRSPARLALAARLGATTCADALTGEYDMVLDAVGAQATRADAVRCLRPGGTAVWVGLAEAPSAFDGNDLVRYEKRVVGSFAYTQEEFAEALALVPLLDLDWTTTVPLGEARDVFMSLAGGAPDPVKAVIVP